MWWFEKKHRSRIQQCHYMIDLDLCCNEKIMRDVNETTGKLAWQKTSNWPAFCPLGSSTVTRQLGANEFPELQNVLLQRIRLKLSARAPTTYAKWYGSSMEPGGPSPPYLWFRQPFSEIFAAIRAASSIWINPRLHDTWSTVMCV